MTIEQQRADFEVWISHFDNDEPPYLYYDDGNYDDWHIQRVWCAWKAAIASLSTQPMELTDDEIIDFTTIKLDNKSSILNYTRAVLAAQREKEGRVC